MQWVQGHLDYCVRPLLEEPWVVDVDATIKPLYGHQKGAVVGYCQTPERKCTGGPE